MDMRLVFGSREVLGREDNLAGHEGGRQPGHAGHDDVVMSQTRHLHDPAHHQRQPDLNKSQV